MEFFETGFIIEVPQPVTFFGSEEHDGAIHEDFDLFTGHGVIEAPEELTDSINGLTTNCQQESKGVSYHDSAGVLSHFNRSEA